MSPTATIRRFTMLTLIAILAATPLVAQKKPPKPGCTTVITMIENTIYRLSGDGLGAYRHGADGARSEFCDNYLLLNLDAFASATRRNARIDLTLPAEPGLRSLGISYNPTLNMNIRGDIALVPVGEVRAVPSLFSFVNDNDGKKYRVNHSGGNGTDLVMVHRVSEKT